MTDLARFLKYCRKADNGCIEWTGSTARNGYGEFHYKNKGPRAHRWSYEYFVGPIPTGLQLDHLCRVRSCVNPDHLEPVTQRENILRGQGLAAQHAKKTHCKQGHEFNDNNTQWRSDGGMDCRACHRRSTRARRARKIADRIASEGGGG